MKIQQLRTPKLNEAPIGDYELVGKWGDKEKSHSFSHAVDRKMIQHPVAVRKARKKFGLTEHILNFYFVNLPGARKFAEYGLIEPEELMKIMPQAAEEILGREGQPDGINVIFVGNAGDNRVPMTAWIMAHRIGHAIQATTRKSGRSQTEVALSWKEYEDDFKDFMGNILENVYDWDLPRNFSFFSKDDKALTKFFEAIGTMRSARQGNFGGRPYEFLYELFAQHITQGKISFRELPRWFGTPRGRQYRIRDQEMAEMYSRDLNLHIADHLGSRIENCLYSATGKYLVM